MERNLADKLPGPSDPNVWAEKVTRAGWIAKGTIYVVIGGLAFELARRSPPDSEADKAGALERVAQAPAGQLLVGGMGVGLLLFALWHVWAAVARNPEGILGAAKRAGWAGLGVSYVLLGATGLEIALQGSNSTSNSSSSATSPSGFATRLFDVPGGRIVGFGIGVGTIGVALYQLNKGMRQDFLGEIDTEDLDPGPRKALGVLGTLGFGARSVVLGLAGWLFALAAWQYDPSEAAGLDQALRTITDAPFGRVVLGFVAAGLASAGAYELITFRRQRLVDE